MFNFFKKKKPEESYSQKPKDELADLEVHSMPKRYTKIMTGDKTSAKKAGLLIIISGGVILIAASAALAWYIYNSSGQPSPAGNQAEVMAPEEETADEDKIKEEMEEAEEDEEELGEKDCGLSESIIFAEQAGVKRNYENDLALVCLGERVKTECRPASVEISNGTFKSLNVKVLGARQDKCLIQVQYPAVTGIYDNTYEIYADSYLSCFYDNSEIENLNYEPGQLFAYLYQQTDPSALSEARNCSGTAYDTWQSEQERIEAEKEAAEKGAENLNPGVDTDGDGLTDLEENTVFVTDINKKDTDDDNYADQTEVLNLYNPAGGGILADSGLVSTYINSAYGYSLLYPKNWQLEDKFNGESVFLFSGVDGSINILIQTNESGQGIIEWYEDLMDSEFAGSVEALNGIEFIYSQSGLTAYLTASGGSDKVIVITYSPEESGSVEFKTVFEMIVKSFKLE